MTDDKPIAESPFARLWLTSGPGLRSIADTRQMSKYVLDAAGAALALDATTELPRMRRDDLFSLAVQATRDGLPGDVIGTILTLASARGSTLALVALAQKLGQHLGNPRAEEGRFAGWRKLRNALREIEVHLSNKDLLEKFDEIHKEIGAAAESATLRQTLAEFRRAGVNGTTHRVIAPSLKSLNHIDGGGNEFRSLA
ncbi:MAG TPA: hypothetical protein DCY26_09145, partial [Hyphomonas sp.]|nr:hypothetical protein [Hyphomonas sp.]